MKRLILIADDDARALTLLTAVLQAEGHTVMTAEKDCGDGTALCEGNYEKTITHTEHAL